MNERALENHPEETCFVISPIGDPNSNIRKRSDFVLKNIIEPAVMSVKLAILRADHIVQPGMITHQVIRHIMTDLLVIADLTDQNANVFYELALRHVSQKPIVQLIQFGQKIPFDLKDVRTIEYSLTTRGIANAIDAITKQIKVALYKKNSVESPVTVTLANFQESSFNSINDTKIKSLLNKPIGYLEVHNGLIFLAKKALLYAPDYLIGINRGGAILGGMIGKRLGMMVRCIELTHRPEDSPSLPIDDSLLPGKRVLLVDDRLHTGINMAKAIDFLLERKAVLFSMVFAIPQGWKRNGFPCEYAYKVTGSDLPFPWEPGASKEWR
jgi:adenine/guanine phosphoribosyltransferase-like PRPP-binding protein